MGESRIDSQGFSVGQWCFPAFSLGRGECITLCFPKQAIVDTFVEQELILPALTGSRPVSGLTLRTSIVVAEAATSPSGWRQRLIQSTPFDWMKKHTALSDDAIASFLQKHNMDRRLPLSAYAGTPRMVLGLGAAYARKPGVIVFSTAGLDPCGVRETFQLVTDHLLECSAIYLAWPFFSQGQEHHHFFPGSVSVSVIKNERLPALAISDLLVARGVSDIAKAPN